MQFYLWNEREDLVMWTCCLDIRSGHTVVATLLPFCVYFLEFVV